MSNIVPFGALGDWLAKPSEWKDLPSHWIELRPDLVIRLQMCDHNAFMTTYEGIVAEAFQSKTAIEQKDLLWSEDYYQRSKPDLTKRGLSLTEQESVHQAARQFAPQLPVWSEVKVK
jgi:hypothetical protein